MRFTQMIKVVTLATIIACFALSVVVAQDGSSSTRFNFQKCDVGELHLIFNIDRSGSMKSVDGAPKSGSRLERTLVVVRKLLFEVYKLTTFPCLEYEALYEIESGINARGTCRQNGYTTMRAYFGFFSWEYFSYSDQYPNYLENYHRLWYEYASDEKYFSNVQSLSSLKGPVMSVTKVIQEYTANKGTDDRKDARNRLLKEVEDAIMNDSDEGILPDFSPSGYTSPSEGLLGIPKYLKAKFPSASNVHVQTFTLTDLTSVGYLICNSEDYGNNKEWGVARDCVGGDTDTLRGFTWTGNNVKEATINGEIRRCKDAKDQVDEHVLKSPNSQTSHFGIGISGSQERQKQYYTECGLEYTENSFVNGNLVEELATTLIGNSLGGCITCQIDILSGLIYGVAECGGSSGEDPGLIDFIDFDSYKLVPGKKSVVENGGAVTYSNTHEDVCEQEAVSIENTNGTSETFDNITICRTKMFQYCADVDGSPTSYTNCGLPYILDTENYHVYQTSQPDDNVTSCQCSCQDGRVAGVDYFCPADSGASAYNDNFKRLLTESGNTQIVINETSGGSPPGGGTEGDGPVVPEVPTIDPQPSNGSLISPNFVPMLLTIVLTWMVATNP